ncbi:MAG: SDR family oxidoreductase [Promethearchaeota archaeon]
MEGKICMITGANSGIGKATAMGLAKMGATIIMVGRDEKRCEEAQKEIIEKTKNKNIDIIICDLSSQQQIHNLVKDFNQKYQNLHVLINNAGIVLKNRSVNADGLEMNFAVNYLAPFLLTNLLLETLKKSAPSRVINVSSGVHKRVSLDFGDLQSEKKYSSFGTYGKSKLALLLFTYELSRKLKDFDVTVNALHPGVVKSNLGRDQPAFSRWFQNVFFKSPERGAETSIYLASSPVVEGITGKYFINKRPAKSSIESYNKENAKKLWDISIKLAKLNIN